MDTVVRLPEPDKVDKFVFDEQSARKLKKAIRQAVDALQPQDRQNLIQQFLKARTLDLDKYLAPKAEPLQLPQERGTLTILITWLRDFGKLPLYPDFTTAERGLNSTEHKLITQAISTIWGYAETIVNKPAYDNYIASVFGNDAEHIDYVKSVVRDSFFKLQEFHGNKAIKVDVVDRGAVWGCEGLTDQTRIMLAERAFKKDAESLMTTLVHESTHAVSEPKRTKDTLYRGMAGFATASIQTKLKTADYYAELFARISAKVPIPIYIPAQIDLLVCTSSEVSVTTGAASEMAVRAWATAMNIHSTLVKWSGYWLPMSPTEKQAFKNISKLLGLTFHKRNPSQGTSITKLDLSIVDNKLNVLARLLSCLKTIQTLPPDNDSTQDDKVNYVLSEALKLAANASQVNRGLLSKSVAKDVKVIRYLAELYDGPDWSSYMARLAEKDYGQLQGFLQN
jgi:hypothetical protein